ncbi:hypothetical protein H6G06_26550 [Anabaena sphaerica FACHB-251]|uniref:Uncharacterized protein n=1 Tax=Anabaena sphaerica FACHB-251 TaxID=2692883 RepID=A0A926WPI9_9NOST|nr:hypothetical protein [Anabaena sphaerica]MBD2296938.1 hypothetical protein [Anabaena sphaerica FACHB-251]
MELRQLKLLLTTFWVILPLVAQASEINLQAGKVKINRDSQGNITVETGKTKLSSGSGISINRRSSNSSTRRKKKNTWKRNCNNFSNRFVTRQLTKIRGSRQRKLQTNTISMSCR